SGPPPRATALIRFRPGMILTGELPPSSSASSHSVDTATDSRSCRRAASSSRTPSRCLVAAAPEVMQEIARWHGAPEGARAHDQQMRVYLVVQRDILLC